MQVLKRTIWNVVVAYLEFLLGDLFTVIADVATAVRRIHLPCDIVTKQIYLNFQIPSNFLSGWCESNLGKRLRCALPCPRRELRRCSCVRPSPRARGCDPVHGWRQCAQYIVSFKVLPLRMGGNRVHRLRVVIKKTVCMLLSLISFYKYGQCWQSIH